ncbi:hypothetical protein [Paraflavitalea speifideaquila]|uniref:hypothetical protein n=1 Tax=Paraflavitalea speifideaquila TaxID=3076558 RepID=UPI0028E2AA8F|nr:hypothetical protein [Paraflavitalea speifideiaquila]
MKKLIIATSLLAALAGLGCNKLLEEEVKSILTPEFLSTEKGVSAGVDAAYAGNRLLWGNQDLFTLTVIGTDEFQRGVDGNGDVNNYSSGFTNSSGQGNNIWTNCYKYINACNGVIKFAPTVDMDANVKNKNCRSKISPRTILFRIGTILAGCYHYNRFPGSAGNCCQARAPGQCLCPDH